MNHTPKILLVDGNNIAHGAYAVHQNSREGLLKTSTGIPTTILFGLLRTLDTFVSKHEVDEVIICWDRFGSRFRKTIFPAYKGNRIKKDMSAFYAELDSAQEHLRDSFGIRQFIWPYVEADDQIGFLARRYHKKGYAVVIFSNDKDFYQLKNVARIWRPCKISFVSFSDIEREYGTSDINKIPYVMGLLGQEGDNIPGICPLVNGKIQKIGFGLAKTTAVLSPFLLGIKSFEECLDEEIERDTKWSPYITQNRKQIQLSVVLAKIRKRKSEFNEEELKELDYSQLTAPVISTKTAEYTARLLEFRTIDITKVLRKLGVKFKGKTGMKKKAKKNDNITVKAVVPQDRVAYNLPKTKTIKEKK